MNADLKNNLLIFGLKPPRTPDTLLGGCGENFNPIFLGLKPRKLFSVSANFGK